MDLKFWKNKSPWNILSEFATKAFAESVKNGLAAITTALTHSTPLGLIVGAGAKGMMDSLLAKSSQIDTKLDKILREPLLSGMKFLHEGILYAAIDENSRNAKDDLLNAAHVSLVKAWTFVIESREDSLFIKCLDAIALAAHSTHWQIAEKELQKLSMDLDEQNIKVIALETEAKAQMEYSKGVHRYLNSTYNDDRPFGYAEQKLFGKKFHKYSLKLEKESSRAREKLDILIDLKEVAARFLVLSKR